MSFDAGQVTSELHLDRSPFIRSLRDARREAARFVRQTYEATLGIDTDDARRTISSLKRQMQSVSESVGLGADTTKARRQIADLVRYAQSIRADVKVGANIAGLKVAREQIRQILASVDGSEAKATVTAEARGFDSAERQTGSLQRDITKLNGSTARMQAQVDGVRGVLRRLSRVDEKMDNLQGRTARMGVAVAGGAAAGLVLSQVTNQFDLISQSMTALGKVKMPLIYAAFGGLPGIIAPVSAALVGLVGQLSAGALGFVAIGGAAAGGATAGLYAYTAAAKAAAGGAMLVREETRKGANEQLAQQRVSILNTAAARSFNLELDKQVIALTKVQATLGTKMLPAFTRMLGLFRTSLPSLTPPLYRLVDGVTAIGESFVSAVLKGQGLGQLQSVLNFVATSGIKAAQAISDMVRVGLAGIQPIIPAATRLLNKITGLSGGALKFVQSSRGMGIITGVVAQIEQKMYAVLGVIGSLSVGLYNLGAAFAPIGSTMLADLGRLTQRFADLTAKGSGFRQEVSNLNTAGIPIIRSLSGVVGALFTQFGRVANAAMNLRMEGTKTRVLVAIFNALRDAATPVASALIRAFATLGPLLPPLIAQFAKLFNNFAAQAPLIGRYVGFLTTLMGIFNRLPPSVQGGIAQVAAFNAIMGGTGMSIAGAATGLVGFVGHLSLLRAVQGKATVGQMMLNRSTYAGAAAWVRATAVSVAHRAALVATTVATKAARVSQIALNWAMRANPIGLLITAVAALGVGFVLLYRRSETFRNIIQSVGRFIKTVAVGAFRALVSAAKSVWTWFQKLPGPVQALISPLGFVIANFGKFKRVAGAAVRGVVAVVRLAGAVLVGVFTGKWGGAIRAAQALFNKLPAGIRGKVMLVVGVVRQVGGMLLNAFRGNWGQAAMNAVRIIGSISPKAGRFLFRVVQIVRGVGAALGRAFRGDWGGAARIALNVIAMISPGAAKFLYKVSRYVKVVGGIISRIFKGDWGGAVNMAIGLFARLFPGTTRTLMKVWRYVQVAVQIVRRIFSGDLGGAISLAIGLFGKLFPGIRDWLGKAIGTIRGWISDVKARFSGMNLFQIGISIIQGLINGIKSMSGALYNAAKGIVGGFLKAVRKRLKSKSPSREMMSIGNDAVAGFVGAIFGGRSKANRSAASLAGAALRGARKGMGSVDMPIRPHLSGGVPKLSPAVVGGQAQARARSARVQQTITHRMAASSEDQARVFREEIGALRKDNDRLATRNVEMAKQLTRTDFFRTAVDEAVYEAAEAESRRRNGGK